MLVSTISKNIKHFSSFKPEGFFSIVGVPNQTSKQNFITVPNYVDIFGRHEEDTR